MPNIDLITLIGTLFRQGLAYGGGMLVAKGMASADQMNSVEGGLLAVAAIALSLWQKHNAATKLAAATVAK